ncbi:transposase [Cystobacter fuscus]
MPRPYSVDLRERAVAAYRRGGRTMEEVAAEFSVSAKTLSHWLKLEDETGSLEPRPRGGGNFSALQGEVLETLKGRCVYTPMPQCRSTSKRWWPGQRCIPVPRRSGGRCDARD